MRKSFLTVALFFLIGIQSQAAGESIRFDFEGIITEANGIASYPSWDINIGDTIKGSWVLYTDSPLIIGSTYMNEGSMGIELGSDPIQSTYDNPISISNDQISVSTSIPDSTAILSTSYGYFADDGILTLDFSGPLIYTLSDLTANLDSLVFLGGTYGLWGFRSGTHYSDTIQVWAHIDQIVPTLIDYNPSDGIFFPIRNAKTGKFEVIYLGP